MMRVAVLVVAAIGFGLSPGSAQAPKESPSAEQAATKTYIREAAVVDMFGLEAGKLALDRSKRDDVRAFARASIATNSDGLRKLRALAGAAQLESTLPKTIDKAHENKLDELRKADGTELDRVYLDMQMKLQETAVALHSSYARATQDGPLKSYAEERADTIERELRQLRQLAELAPARS